MDHPAFQSTQTPIPPAPDAAISPSQPTKPSNKNLKKWIIIVGIALIVLLTGGAYVLSQQKSQNPETASTVKPTITSPSTTPDPTADWKTYTNTRYGYSVKYPENTKIDTNLDTAITFSRNITPKPGIGGQGICCGMTLYLRPYGYLVNPSISKDVIINGYAAKLVNHSTYNHSIYINNPDKMKALEVSISTDAAVEPYDKEDFELFNQILSTFKFTENQTSKKRQFDVNALFFDKQKYPAEIINTPAENLVGMNCSAYDYYGDDKSTEIIKYKKIVQQNYSEKNVTGFQYCKSDNQKIIVSYGLGPCGGGCSGEPHLGLITNDTLEDITTITNSKRSSYFSCSKPLQLTRENILYYECGGGDGGAGSSSIYKLDLSLKSAEKIIECSLSGNPSKPEESIRSCN